MLAKVIKAGLALFATLLAMGFIAAVVFSIIGILAPQSMISSPIYSWVLLLIGSSIVITSGILIFRKIYHSFDDIMYKLGREQQEVQQWIREFYDTNRTSTRVLDDPPGNSPGPGKSRAKYSSFSSVIMLSPLVA